MNGHQHVLMGINRFNLHVCLCHIWFILFYAQWDFKILLLKVHLFFLHRCRREHLQILPRKWSFPLLTEGQCRGRGKSGCCSGHRENEVRISKADFFPLLFLVFSSLGAHWLNDSFILWFNRKITNALTGQRGQAITRPEDLGGPIVNVKEYGDFKNIQNPDWNHLCDLYTIPWLPKHRLCLLRQRWQRTH